MAKKVQFSFPNHTHSGIAVWLGRLSQSPPGTIDFRVPFERLIILQISWVCAVPLEPGILDTDSRNRPLKHIPATDTHWIVSIETLQDWGQIQLADCLSSMHYALGSALRTPEMVVYAWNPNTQEMDPRG